MTCTEKQTCLAQSQISKNRKYHSYLIPIAHYTQDISGWVITFIERAWIAVTYDVKVFGGKP